MVVLNALVGKDLVDMFTLINIFGVFLLNEYVNWNIANMEKFP